MFSLKNLIAVSFLLVAASCNKNPYLYDRAGFDPDARPVVAPNPNAVNTRAPDYYQGGQQVPYQYQQQPYGQHYQQQQYQQPQYVQPAPYAQQYQGGSRYYSNPYAIPPANNYYPQRYDGDQYYVPPTYYNGGADNYPRATSSSLTSSTNY